jgi:hypothetical protein
MSCAAPSPEAAFTCSSASRVPDRAMVPMFATTSSRVIPIPSSSMVRVRASRSGVSRIFGS